MTSIYLHPIIRFYLLFFSRSFDTDTDGMKFAARNHIFGSAAIPIVLLVSRKPKFPVSRNISSVTTNRHW